MKTRRKKTHRRRAGRSVQTVVLPEVITQASPESNSDADSVGETTKYSSSPPRPDEYNDKQLEKYASNYQLICLLENGVPPKVALARLELKRTTRWARGLYRQWKLRGPDALFDRRTSRKNKPTVLTDEVTKLILMWWAARPAAGPTAIASQVKKECERLTLKPPSESSVKQYIAKIPEYLKLFRAGKPGRREWEQSWCPVVRVENTEYSNERWQTDHTPVDIWVRVRDADRWVPCQAYLTAYLDAHSRSIPSVVLSAKHPDAWTTSLLMMKAVMPKEDPRWKNRGLPTIVQPDRGADFMSAAVFTAFGKLKIYRDPDPPHYPNGKGKIERWFETIDHACFRLLPGHKEAVGRSIEAAAKHVHVLLTVPQLRKEIERWIIEEYHQRKHSETGRKPIELWEETVRFRWPDSEDDLNLFLLKSDEERTVSSTGIRFLPRNSAVNGHGDYWAPELGYNVGLRVRPSYNPEDMKSIMVYCAATGKFICEAWLMGQPNSPYTAADVKDCRRNISATSERLKDYRKEVEESDRRIAQQAEWAEARRLAKAEVAEDIPDDFATGEADGREDIKALLEQFRRQDRGEE